MPNIKILPTSLRNKISAGEVIERPASVVKELLENSIDAQSTKIEINIIGAGRKLIRVADNGCGMDSEDVLIAFERYATSKISSEADLYNIKTLGFRGEALSSISAVSKMRVFTGLNLQHEASDYSLFGTFIEIISGKIKEVKACSALGTTIEVRDLFFNTPARRKFLKSDTTENHHIIDIVTKEAIAQPHIAFELIMDDQDVLRLPQASSERERLLQIFGKEFLDRLLEANAEYGQISIKAFISDRTNFRGNRNNQFIFINKRTVRDQAITHAIYKSYDLLIPHDKHPIFLIFININPELVDFNVHPTKKEVRFKDKSLLFNYIIKTLQEVISTSHYNTEYLLKIPDNQMASSSLTVQDYSLSSQPPHTIAESMPLYSPDYPDIVPSIYLGETFVAIPFKDGLSIIDYHAAHERIVYEKLLKKFEIQSIRLLFPLNIRLDTVKYKTIIEHLELLNEFGFEIEDFGHGSVIVRGLPVFLGTNDMQSLLSDVAGLLRDVKEINDNTISDELDSVRRKLAAKIACHSSIRGKEVPDNRILAGLLKDLSLTESPDICPHGRPTRIEISLTSLRKMFKK